VSSEEASQVVARVLDGRALSDEVLADLVERSHARAAELGRPVGLAIISVGHDPPSEVYTRRLTQAAGVADIAVRAPQLDTSIRETDFQAVLETLNHDSAIDGILVQLPLPPHLSQRAVAETLDGSKDVDGITLQSAGNLFLNLPTFVPSTCGAVIELLDRSGIGVVGRRAVVVGASNVVGKPLAFTLLHRNATVTICHIATRDLAHWTRQAEILVVAAGRPGLITGAMVQPGAAVVDVGITLAGPHGEVVGDVDAASVRETAGALSPVPGGVGPLTALMLLRQCVTGPRAIGAA
jgi:methylenetetrahydrofolate dehydrogenase (NADP+)/methenyltetrahydrofolate cyclohydrolase